MDNFVTNRSEIVFLYDVKDANPNGDPLDENRPRIDEETGINIVTDVRLKRTIRDYLYNFKDQEIFVREIEYGAGFIQDAKRRAEDFLPKDFDESKAKINEKKEAVSDGVLNECIDVRLFGATIPISMKNSNEKGSVTHTGPVQFKIGRSMHKVYIKHFRGTGAFASGEELRKKTFREEDFLLYSLINFYGVINENVASETKLTDDDVTLLMDAVWNGTKNLISRSKVGQVPRLLLKVNYSEGNYHIGDINFGIKLKTDLADEEIRDISEFKLDISDLMTMLIDNKDKIYNIEYKIDERLKLQCNGIGCNLPDVLDNAGLALTEFSF